MRAQGFADAGEQRRVHRHLALDDRRDDVVLVLQQRDGGLDGGLVAGEHVLARRVEVDDLQDAEAARADGLDDLLERGEVERLHRGHLTARAGVVGLAAGLDDAQRVDEVERADVREVVVLAEAEAEGQLGVDALGLEDREHHVVGDEHAELDVDVAVEGAGVVLAVVAAEVAAERVGGLREHLAGARVQARQLVQHSGVPGALPGEHEDEGHRISAGSSGGHAGLACLEVRTTVSSRICSARSRSSRVWAAVMATRKRRPSSGTEG